MPQKKNNINREILTLAVPAIVTNITTPLLGLVDTALTGHMGSPAFLGAIALGASIFSLVYWPLNFLRMGTSGLTSQAYGARKNTLNILLQAIIVALLSSVVLLLISSPLCNLILKFMNGDSEVTDLAYHYFMIIIFGAPAVLCTYSLTGWFLGLQDSKAPMWIALITNLVNVAISVFLVQFLNFKIEGVAIGTLSAQWIGLMSGIIIALYKYTSFKEIIDVIRFHFKDLLSDSQLKRFFSVNSDIFLRTLCLAAVTLWFTHAGANINTSTLAANSLLLQLFILFSFFMDGFAFAGEAMAGKYFGANNRLMLSRTIKGIFKWGISLALLFTFVFLIFGKSILFLLTEEKAIVDVALQYLPWAIAIPIAGVAAFVWDGIFIGCTLTRQMLKSMFLSAIVFFVIYLICYPYLLNHGLWMAFIFYLLSRGIIQSLLWQKASFRWDF